MVGFSRVMAAAVAGALIAVLIGVTVASADRTAAECVVSGDTLAEARDSYASSCQVPRVDCDPIDDVWFCSSRVIGDAAPGGVTAAEAGASEIGDGNATIVVTAPPPPEEPPASAADPTDPTPTDPAPTDPSTTDAPTPTEAPVTTEAPDTTPAPTTTAAPTTTPAPTTAGSCSVVTIEAETLALTGDWSVLSDSRASGGQYITWEGLSAERNNGSPDDVISTDITIGRAGSYRFTWAMRQPDGVESDKANDSWLNFPDADRFGPTGGGSYGGFIKVFGNAKTNFGYAARADVNHQKSTIAIDFDRPGTYTLQIAGRSHGHQIDRIVIHHQSVSQADAIAGRDTGCDQVTTTTVFRSPPETAPAPSPSPAPATCSANSSGTANLAKDLISLQYDHAPDRDDGHATVAGLEVADELGFTPWVIGGAYGADNASRYNPGSEAVMDATWGPNGWQDAHNDWPGVVRRTADRWQATLEACGDIWIAEGGQSDLSADVVRELRNRMPSLDTEARIHLVQHSDWNERNALDADLAYVRANTDYIRIEDGNNSNDTADLNVESYRGAFPQTALDGPHGDGWAAAFDYYDPVAARLDFSDTVELLHIVGIGTDEVDDIESFADRFMR